MLIVFATAAFCCTAVVAPSCGSERPPFAPRDDAAEASQTSSASGSQDPPPWPTPPESGIPFVACGSDGGSDGDADAGDAAQADADADVDADVEAFPCDAPPPPRCLEGGWLVGYEPGACVDGGCAFMRSYLRCECVMAGDDAGDYCYPIAGK